MYSFVYKDMDFAHKRDERTLPSNDYVEHTHNFYELYFFLRGEVTYTVEKQVRKIEPGDIILIVPGDHHVAAIDPDVPYERYVFKFPEELIPPHLRGGETQRKSVFYLSTAAVTSYFEKSDAFVEAYEDSAEDLYALLSSLLSIILIALRRSAPSPEIEDTTASLTATIIDYVNANIRRPLDLSTLSAHFNYSQSYLSVEFKKNMHVSLMQYIRNKKIFAAKNMIRSGAKPTHVSAYLGFDEYSTFYRAYTKIIGSPPSHKTV